MKLSAVIAVAICGFLGGCAYNIAPTNAPAVNVYSSYDSKIPGTWVLVVDPSVEFSRDIKPSTYICQAHKYPFSTGDSIKASVTQTLTNVFEELAIRPSSPSAEEMRSQNWRGVIVIRLDSFQPRLACQQGFWSATCSATADLSFGLEVNGPDGRLLGTSVGSSKTADGDSGAYCGDAANVFSEAYRLALRDALERLAEKVSNTQRLRGEGS